MSRINKFINDQLSVWPMAAANFRALKNVQTREMEINGLKTTLQFNPCRIASTTAETDPASIASRPCFLCPQNRPKEQFHLKFDGRKRRRYNIQVNPFPIFPDHLVIARDEHIPQAIWHHFPDMIEFVRCYPEFTSFYNGPESGASAPDHLHFQAVPKGLMPVEREVDAFLENPGEPLATNRDASLYHFRRYARGIFALKATTAKSLAKLFYRLLCCCAAEQMVEEPKFNLYTWKKKGEFRCFVMFRESVRSHHYYSAGDDHLAISPGAADMAGIFVAPKQEDFAKATPELLSEMLDEVTINSSAEEMILWRLTRKQPQIEVGIKSGKEIVFEIISDGAGPQKVSWADGRINYNGALYDELTFDSITRSTLFAEPTFILHDVTIGIDFHWQRNLELKYAGRLKFIVEGDHITAVNTIGLEDYILSVISSEMKATSSLELLKTHAVISRTWALARINDRRAGKSSLPHESFDVCADDHCQRYQGLTMVIGPNPRRAVDSTWGKTLKYKGELCDTRYSKCCGGKTERFSACWEDVDFPYLQSVDDPWCDCEKTEVLATVLNDYDLETGDFHDWEIRYDNRQLSEIITEKTDRKLGILKYFEVLERGDSGRISKLRIVGSEGEMTIGKELEIRRVLSPTHLKSSWFETQFDGNQVIIKGHGWGHGVGLCQIGAAVMADSGKNYQEILSHYYLGAEVSED